jgi:hypothetical protein
MFVYMIVNRENDKIYIGKTVTSDLPAYLKGKLRDALGGRYNGRSYLFRAMAKYPSCVWDIFPLISSLKTNEELCFWERVCIAEYDSQNPEIGYNLCDGGQGRSDRGWHHSDESKAKISAANKGRQLYPRTLENEVKRLAGLSLSVEERNSRGYFGVEATERLKSARAKQDESRRLAAHKVVEQLHGANWIQKRAASHRGSKHDITSENRAAIAAAVRQGNHRRWHEKRGIKNVDCDFCRPLLRAADSASGLLLE